MREQTEPVKRKPFIGAFVHATMLRTLGFFVTLVVLVYCPVHSGLQHGPPLSLERTEQLTEWEYEMVTWWNPFIFDNTLWLVYQELTFDNVKILKYRTYKDEWSSPQILSDTGNFMAAVEDGEVLTVFWNTAVREESVIVKSICSGTFAQEWSSPLCTEPEPFIGDRFIVELPDSVWLVQSRRKFWEYQVFQEGRWSEKEVLTTTEEYDKILNVLPRGDELWIFYETGESDIYYRVLNQEISESYPLITEGFPYLRDVLLYDGTILVFLEVQEEGADQKTLAYRKYDGEWSPLEAVATPEEGFLSGGSAVRVSDGSIFVFWNATESVDVKPWEVDIHYRVYDGRWSEPYTLTHTPDVWETSPTAVEYNDGIVVIWREKESGIVYASYAHLGEGEFGEPEELQQVAPKEEPERPTPPSQIEKYLVLLPIGGVLAALLIALYVKKKGLFKKEKAKQVKIGKRRKTKRK